MRLESAKTRRVSGKLSDVGHLGFLPLILIINIDEPSQYSFLLNLHIASVSSLTLCSRKPLPIKGNMVCVCAHGRAGVWEEGNGEVISSLTYIMLAHMKSFAYQIA